MVKLWSEIRRGPPPSEEELQRFAAEQEPKIIQQLCDDAGVPAMIEAIRDLHGLEATWLESVTVIQTREGQSVWTGEVQVFSVEHPEASHIFAWSAEDENGERRFHAVLGTSQVTGPQTAVHSALLANASRSAK